MARVKGSKELKQMNLLYVEDEEYIRESLSYILQRNVKNLFTAVDGEDGLQKYKELKDDIDIVISDIKMPKLDGLEMSREIKEIDETQHIVLTTAFGDIEYLKKAIEIGIDGYSIKPIDRNQLFKKLNKIAKNIRAHKEIEEFTNLITIILNEQKESVLLLDEELNIKLYNNSFKKEMCKDVCEQKSILDLFKEYKKLDDNQPITKEWFEDLNDSKKSIIYKNCNNNNSKLFYQISAKKTDSYILLSSTDVTEIQLKNLEYKNRAFIDQLTQVYNRHILEKGLDEFYNRYIYLIILDIDDFKKINDTYGHPMGDKVLKTLASTLKHHFRESDLIIRWGGEEFLILLKDVKNTNMLYNLAEKLREEINKLRVDKDIRFTSSLGLASGFIKNQDELSMLIKNADIALYRAKQNGKNRVEL